MIVWLDLDDIKKLISGKLVFPDIDLQLGIDDRDLKEIRRKICRR